MTGALAFAAFREAVHDDYHLMTRLRRPLDRDAYVAKVVEAGAECGFRFEAIDVWNALREGERTWLEQAVEVTV